MNLENLSLEQSRKLLERQLKVLEKRKKIFLGKEGIFELADSKSALDILEQSFGSHF